MFQNHSRAITLFTLMLLGIATAWAQTPPILNLPTGPLTPSTSPSASAVHTLNTPTQTVFTITFANLPTSLSISNGPYTGLCSDYYGDFQNNRLNPSLAKMTPISTYDTAHLPANAQNPNWDKVNWILNNLPTGTLATWIEQQAVWRLLSGNYAPAAEGYPLPQPATDNYYNQALTAGAGFIPGPGQIVGILMYIDGMYNYPAGENGFPGNGSPNNFQDLLISVPLPPGAIGDYVWTDTNQNGVQDAGEPGIDGVTVKLCRDASCTNVFESTTTATFMGNHGHYEFTGLPLGTYWVSIDNNQPILSSLVPTSTGAGTSATDSNVNPTQVTLTNAVTQDLTIDFGYSSAAISAIGDFVWQDNNVNGIQDAGEPGLSGLNVKLCADAACNTVLKTTTTDGNGHYAFTSLQAGTYYVVVVPGAGFVATASQVNFPTNGSSDSGGNVAGVPTEVILPYNYTDNTIDFGFIPPANGAIGDFVWHDLNRNGIQDAGEPGINNVTVKLYNSNSALVGTTTTLTYNGQPGYYQFTGLAAGTYTVVVDTTTLPSGYTATTNTAPGSVVSNDSNGSPATVTLATNLSVDETIDFGYVSPCAGVIGDFVWNDLNRNGIQDSNEPGLSGVTVSLYDSNHVFLASTTTDTSGKYQFTGRCAATYSVEVTAPGTYVATTSTAQGSTTSNDSNGSPATVTLRIDETNLSIDFGYYLPMSASCAVLSNAVQGIAISPVAMTASGGAGGPYTFSATGLPTGLTMATDGTISGTPTQNGTFNYSVTITDAAGNKGTFNCSVIVAPPITANCLVISPVQGIAVSTGPISGSGGVGGLYTFSATGLPTGLTMASNGSISGTPTVTGTFNYTVTVADSAGNKGTVNCSVTVAPPITANCLIVNAIQGIAVSTGPMSGSGGAGGPYTFSATGLPTGLTIASDGSISGTPTVNGTFNYTVTVTDSAGNKGTVNCSVTVAPPITANCLIVNAIQGIAVSTGPMSGSGGAGGPYTFSATGLPTGLTMASNGSISGTPTVNGTFNYTVTVTDSVGNKGTVNCSVAVAPPITANCLVVNAIQGIAVNTGTMSGSGGAGGPYTFSATGLPTGLTMASNGSISGTPTVNGTFNYTVTVTDSAGNKGTVNCSVTVAPPITANCLVVNAIQGIAVSAGPMNGSGGAGGPYSFSATGLPTGLTMASNGSISGTPTVNGTFNYTVTVTDSAGNKGTVNCSVTVAPPITANCLVINAIQGIAVSTGPMTGSGGAGGPYTFSATGLPTGLTMASNGSISGTPTVNGTFNYTVTIKDSAGNTGTVNCSVQVKPPASASCIIINAVQGIAITPVQFTASGGAGAPYTFSATGLPNGLTMASNGTISGTPTQSGIFSYTVTIKDAANNTSTVNCAVTVLPAITANCVVITAVKNIPIVPATMTASGGAGGPYIFSASGLPAGLSMSSGGTISGTPTASGVFNYSVTITDSAGNHATTNCSVTVTPVTSNPPIASADAATIGFWHNKNGQALILSLNGGSPSNYLANWLASIFPYLYGPSSSNDLTNKTNVDVAALFQSFFNVKGQNTSAQTMGGALACYVTSTTLAGSTAGSYGFNLTAGGTCTKTYNVGSDGTLIGLSNNTSYTVLQLLQQANLDIKNNNFNATAFNDIFSGINQTGDIQ